MANAATTIKTLIEETTDLGVLVGLRQALCAVLEEVATMHQSSEVRMMATLSLAKELVLTRKSMEEYEESKQQPTDSVEETEEEVDVDMPATEEEETQCDCRFCAEARAEDEEEELGDSQRQKLTEVLESLGIQPLTPRDIKELQAIMSDLG